MRERLIHSEVGFLTSEYTMRVWHWYRKVSMSNFEFQIDYYGVYGEDEAKMFIHQLGLEDLTNPDVLTNVFGLQIYDGVSWVEWLNEEGNSIEDLIYAD